MASTKYFLVYIVALCFVIVGCGQEEERPIENVREESEILEGVEEKAPEIEESAVNQSDETETKGSEIIERVKTEAEKIKEKTSSVIGEQFDKAKAVFDKDREEESITERGDGAAKTVEQLGEEKNNNIDSLESKTSSIVKELIEKARMLFDQGKYKESIIAAEDVLNNHDSDSQEAMDIISMAKEKLKELASEQTKAVIDSSASEELEEHKEGITDKLMDLGQ